MLLVSQFVDLLSLIDQDDPVRIQFVLLLRKSSTRVVQRLYSSGMNKVFRSEVFGLITKMYRDNVLQLNPLLVDPI